MAKIRIVSCGKDKGKMLQIAKDLEEIKEMFKQIDATHRLRDTLYILVNCCVCLCIIFECISLPEQPFMFE